MKQYLLIITILTTLLLGDDNTDNNNKEADCIILKEENSIICKYSHERINENTEVTFNWIEPDGQITRTRVMTLPAGHGSVYDYRYLEGRTHGTWTFEVIDGEDKITTEFIID